MFSKSLQIASKKNVVLHSVPELFAVFPVFLEESSFFDDYSIDWIHIHQIALGVHQRQGVDLVIPDDVVAVVQRGVLRSSDQLLDGGHERGDGGVIGGVVDAVITRSHNAQQLAVGGAVSGDGDGGVAGAGFQLQHVVQGGSGSQVGVGDDITGLVALDAADHGSLVLNALRAVDEGHAALTGQCNVLLL